MSRTMGVTKWSSLCTIVVAAVGLIFAITHPDRTPAPPGMITGPYASLLSASTGLGPSGGTRVQLVAGLSADARPAALIGWAQQHGLTVRWRPGDGWAVLAGAPATVGAAFDVAVHDYRGRLDQQQSGQHRHGRQGHHQGERNHLGGQRRPVT